MFWFCNLSHEVVAHNCRPIHQLFPHSINCFTASVPAEAYSMHQHQHILPGTPQQHSTLSHHGEGQDSHWRPAPSPVHTGAPESSPGSLGIAQQSWHIAAAISRWFHRTIPGHCKLHGVACVTGARTAASTSWAFIPRVLNAIFRCVLACVFAMHSLQAALCSDGIQHKERHRQL